MLLTTGAPEACSSAETCEANPRGLTKVPGAVSLQTDAMQKDAEADGCVPSGAHLYNDEIHVHPTQHRIAPGDISWDGVLAECQEKVGKVVNRKIKINESFSAIGTDVKVDKGEEGNLVDCDFDYTRYEHVSSTVRVVFVIKIDSPNKQVSVSWRDMEKLDLCK
mmetsp:Transcript_113270/g.293214  ORF Transcript_113270/g.293214 Transcript_113270/m.293214 type:complete len:164 (-) Transcript_113270:27-518(-)